jgi:hypothetical protein
MEADPSLSGWSGRTVLPLTAGGGRVVIHCWMTGVWVFMWACLVSIHMSTTPGFSQVLANPDGAESAQSVSRGFWVRVPTGLDGRVSAPAGLART